MTISEPGSHFGVCPVCGKHDGYVNAGKSHVFFCSEHAKSWIGGANLFDSWRDETEDEQRAKYEAARISETERVAGDEWFGTTAHLPDLIGWNLRRPTLDECALAGRDVGHATPGPVLNGDDAVFETSDTPRGQAHLAAAVVAFGMCRHALVVPAGVYVEGWVGP
jgi:hypothetical protein